MNRRGLLHAAYAGVLSLAVGTSCVEIPRRSPKLPRLGYLSGESAETDAPLRDSMLQGLRDLGHVEGQNITIDYRFTDGQPERAAELARELVALQPDALLAFATSQVMAAMQATTTIPIIIHTGNPVLFGFVTSLARPGGNVTGVSISPPEMYSKRLELLKAAFPSMTRVAHLSVFGSSPGPSEALMIDQAPRLGVQVQLLQARGPADLPNAFASAIAGHADAFSVPDDPWMFSYREQIIAFAAQQRLPAIYGRKEYVQDGGLLAYGQNITASRRRLATYVDKILKGANPAETPVEQPTTFDLAVNLRTAQDLRLAFAPTFAAQVTEWVQ